MYEDLFAVIVNGILYEKSVANTEKKAIERYMRCITHCPVTDWEDEVRKGAEVNRITITI